MNRNSARGHPIGPRKPLGVAATPLTAALLSACAAATPPAPPIPSAEAAAIAEALEADTRLQRPLLIRFDWSLSEQSSRGSGRGVARAEPPAMARLDLFLGNGETAGMAAVVGDRLFLSHQLPDGVMPPPDFLWAALGVFRPGKGWAFVEARGQGESVVLHYRRPDDGELRYHVESGRLTRVEGLEDGHVVHEVVLTRTDGERYPREATYRHLGQRRALRLETVSIEEVDSHPDDIWRPLG